VATNRYTSSCSVALGASKSVSVGGEEKAPAEGEFSFELLDSDGTVLQTVTNDAQGNVSFEPIDYAASDDGHGYTYTIREVAGTDDYVYDNATYTATVALTDNGDGTMSSNVTYRRADGTALAAGELPAFVNRRTSEVPLTGKGGTGGLLAMGFVVLGGFAGLWVWSRRRRHDD
jgi:pilin isopeptide linkage protein/LPXTG-motif cell wall-anchored protein